MIIYQYCTEVLDKLVGINKIELFHTQTKAKYQKVVTQSNSQNKTIKLIKCSV